MKFPSLIETISGIVVGGVDLGMHEVDAKQGYSKPFENATDLYRLALTVGGMGYYSWKGSAMGLVIYDNSLPLLTESVVYGIASVAGHALPGAPTADPVNVVNQPAPRPASQARPVASSSMVNLV